MSLIQVERDLWLPDRSLKFGAATTDLVNCGTGASLDNLTSPTFLMWLFIPVSWTPASVFMFDKGTAFPNRQQIQVLGGPSFNITTNRATASAAATANFTAFRNWPGFGAWLFLALQSDFTNTTGNKIFLGTATSPPTEPTTPYATQQTGSGANLNNSGATAYVGNRTAADRAWPGNIAGFAVFNRLLGTPEIIHYWKNFPRVGTQASYLLGDNATGTQWDLSGSGNNGTVTGATLESGPAQAYMAQRNPFAVSFGALEWLRHRKNRIRRAA